MNPKFIYFKDRLINMSHVLYADLTPQIVTFYLSGSNIITFNDFNEIEYNSLCQNLGLI